MSNDAFAALLFSRLGFLNSNLFFSESVIYKAAKIPFFLDCGGNVNLIPNLLSSSVPVLLKFKVVPSFNDKTFQIKLIENPSGPLIGAVRRLVDHLERGNVSFRKSWFSFQAALPHLFFVINKSLVSGKRAKIAVLLESRAKTHPLMPEKEKLNLSIKSGKHKSVLLVEAVKFFVQPYLKG